MRDERAKRSWRDDGGVELEEGGSAVGLRAAKRGREGSAVGAAGAAVRWERTGRQGW